MSSHIDQSPAYKRFYHRSGPSSNHQQRQNQKRLVSLPRSPLSSSKPYDYLFKVLLCGDAGVGKTNLISRFCDGAFSSLYVSTIGVDFKSKIVECFGRTAKLQIWDPAGQERFGGLIRAYFRGANAVMFVYDITRKESFDHVRNWRQSVESELGPIYSTIPKMLIGNKLDMDMDRRVTFADGSDYAEFARMRFVETSAVNDDNVNMAFDLLVEDLVAQKEYENEHGILTLDGVDVDDNLNHGLTLSRKHEKPPATCAGSSRFKNPCQSA